LRLRQMMERREDARDPFARVGARGACEETGAFAGVAEPRGEETVERREHRGGGRRVELAGVGVQARREPSVDRRGERRGTLGRQPFRGVLHGGEELRRDGARREDGAQVGELGGRAPIQLVAFTRHGRSSARRTPWARHAARHAAKSTCPACATRGDLRQPTIMAGPPHLVMLLRHAIAEDQSATARDEDRRLTGGKAQAP
jgi:hypothetical protein